MPAIRVQAEEFDIGEETRVFCAKNATSGGVATFIGQMRNFSGVDRDAGTAISEMTLEHYPGMAEKQLEDISSEACARWPLDDVLVIHRYGNMAPGDPIVLVAVASAHREPAFQACQFLMDWLKTQAPFWKKEVSTDGSRWVDANASDESKAKLWTHQKPAVKV